MRFRLATRARLRAVGAADEKTVFCCHHFSHNGGHVLYDDFSARVAKEGFLTSYDGMEYEFQTTRKKTQKETVMDYDTFPVTAPLSRKERYERGANCPTVITKYRCACGWGKLEYHCVPGFDDDFYILKCLRCKKKYRYVTRVGYEFEYYLTKK